MYIGYYLRRSESGDESRTTTKILSTIMQDNALAGIERAQALNELKKTLKEVLKRREGGISSYKDVSI